MMRLFKILLGVRTPVEFKEEHAENSIFFTEIPRELATLKAKGTTIILCCRNGARSYFAQTQLEKAGIDCINAGSFIINSNQFALV